MNLRKLLECYGKLFSQELGIDVKKEPFKCFLASILRALEELKEFWHKKSGRL